GDLTRNWWAVVLRGVLAIIFGLFALFLPGITLTALVLLFGAYALVDGVFAIVSAIRGQAGRSWWELAIEGIAGIAAGVIAL
ncbi:MAG: HdeD family acid-resistance protein, partial [Gemmatimonadetes bacterium]|nr:HdeD family acid-resistance protein [Gemmatimonadota bacterium]NIR39387.1 HdeD family acid-resistance protein [Actinomycetota bacterium]NIS34130.1 HdeD family acid-resistance protein [Actinomycetota bacterium]NIU68916.1 HdeD family acid-resistance protein [Actinomycetota bacterium]NIW30765.1 HdeD family acid-resistance protein [Actinomycetota bacterium]